MENITSIAQKNIDAAQKRLQAAAENALDFLIDPSPKTHETLLRDKSFWEAIVSTYIEDDGLSYWILQAMHSHDERFIAEYRNYLINLSMSAESKPEPQNMTA